MAFHPVMAERELAEGRTVTAAIEGRPIAISRSGERLYAFDDLCPHSGARLGLGRTAKGVVSCPLHGAKFDLATGVCLSRQMGLPPVVTHRVRVVEGVIEVELSPTPITQPVT
jgi:nitrite reductase/ring-hydroxylating ferredoxin subunit